MKISDPDVFRIPLTRVLCFLREDYPFSVKNRLFSKEAEVGKINKISVIKIRITPEEYEEILKIDIGKMNFRVK